MHWLMTCSSVTCTPRNVTVTSLHIGQVIQTVLIHKSLCKLVTDVMIIAGEMFVLQHQLVSDMLIEMLPQIKPQFSPLPVQKCRDGKGPTDCEQSFIVLNYKGKGDAQDGGNYQGLKRDALDRDNYRA